MNALKTTLMLLSLCSAATAASAVETIALRSGQVGGFPGLPTQFDSTMTFGNTVGSGPLSGSPFVAADYNASATNPAVVVSPYTSWIPALTFDPQARWVGTAIVNLPFTPPNLGASSSALYRVPFNVTTTGITSATMSIAWAADDTLGDQTYGGANPIGAYLRDSSGNVTALSPVAGGGFSFESNVLNMNITGAISTGANELFLYQRDQGAGISGLIFGAEMRIIPAPGAGALAGLGILAMTRRRR